MSKYIGNYEIVSELGRGGMGVVYKAREESLQRFVAIKMLGNQLVDNESVALRFMREARAVADLNHPNLVQVFRVDRHEEQPYFVMEYVEGESLKRLIQREDKMQPLRALQILKEVAAGLAAAHDKGVVHRDIKPENIMLTKYGGVKVVDFGIARVEEPGTRLTTTGIGLGTPSYLSPEVCLSQDVDQRSDIFSLGVVLFEMLTGDTPFKSDSPFELMTKVVEARIPDIKALNPNVDDGVKQILAKMIAKRPKLRYQNCNELISDIEDYRAGRVPRWARSMPLDNEPVDAPSEQAESAGDDEGPAVVESSDAATTPIPASESASTDAPPSEPTVALDPEPERGRGGIGRGLVLAAVLLLLAGGAIAGSWYLVAGPDRSMLAMFDPTPDAAGDANDPASNSPVEVRDDVPPQVDSGQIQMTSGDPGAPLPADEAAPEPQRAAVETEMPADPDAGFRFAVDGVQDDPAAEDDGPAEADVTADTSNVSASADSGAGFRIEVAEPAVVDEAPAGADSSSPVVAVADAGPAAGADDDEAAARALVEPGESSGEPLASVTPTRAARTEPAAAAAINSRVAVIAVGDPAVARVVAREVKQALRDASFDVMDEQMIEGLVYAESLAGVARTAQDAGAGVLVYADVVPVGERDLLYYGRRDLQYLASLEVRVLDLNSSRNLGPATAEKLEYVALTAEQKARRAAVPVARNVVNRLRAWRVMRAGDGQG
ncbi:MAG: hypothetical protein CMP07_04520 [Xanthomonadales bacterium]|nr:hypothetical protein [Xanthomonadales bacterium]